MSSYILQKEKLPKFITELIGKYKVFAPVKDNEVTIFKEIKNSKEINLEYSNSKLPPKNLLFSQTETLFNFTPGTKGKIQSPKFDCEKKVIFGL